MAHAFGTAMLERSPLAFALALALDPRAVNQQMQRAFWSAIRDLHGEGLLAAAEGAEIRHLPVQADALQQALHEPGRLAQRHAE